MSRMLVMVLGLTVVVLSTGCSVNGINGLINGSGIDLSTLDVNSLLSQLTSALGTS